MAELPLGEKTGTKPSRRAYLSYAAVCAVAAAFIAWVAATRDPGLDVPPTIAYIAAFIFALVAARLVNLSTDPNSKGDGFAFLFCAAMATIGGWIAFGPGPRTCTTGMSDIAETHVTGLSCRVPFGVGAAITAAVAIYALARALRASQLPKR